MNKNQLVNGKASYVSPSAKTVILKMRSNYLQSISNPGERWIEGGGGQYLPEEIINNGSYE